MSDIVERLKDDVQYEWRQIMRDATAEIERLRARVAELEADRDRLFDACKEANEWLVAMTLKAAFNQDNKTAQDEAASIVREVTSHLYKAIAESARAANGEVKE